MMPYRLGGMFSAGAEVNNGLPTFSGLYFAIPKVDEYVMRGANVISIVKNTDSKV